jgi:enterochelin esterase-like enzyme
MVLVMLRSSPVYPRDTECTDIPGGPQVQTFLAQDVPWEVTHHYRVQPSTWGIIGDSTGGYCAAKIAMTDPYVFHAAVALSGYFTTLHDNTTGNLWNGSRVLRELNSPDWRLQHLPAPPVSVLVTTSRDERGPYGIANSRRFLALARPPMQVSSIISAHGGHDLNAWAPLIPRSLAWLSHRL